jgi:hypothetical protein
MMCACSNANVASAFGRNDPDEIGAAYFPLTEIIAKDLSTNQFAQKTRRESCGGVLREDCLWSPHDIRYFSFFAGDLCL